MKNKSKCYSYDEITPELLKEFSEGCAALENLLNCCYENKIETRACCSGHEEDGSHHKPYIMLIVAENQKKIMESMINVLFSLGTLSQHIKASLRKNNNTFLLTFNFDSHNKDLRDLFFYSISRSLSGIITTKSCHSGIFEGLFDAYESLNKNGNITLDIDSTGIAVFEERLAYLKFTENDTIEVPEDESDFSAEVQSKIKHIEPDKIEEFISSKTKNPNDDIDNR